MDSKFPVGIRDWRGVEEGGEAGRVAGKPANRRFGVGVDDLVLVLVSEPVALRASTHQSAHRGVYPHTGTDLKKAVHTIPPNIPKKKSALVKKKKEKREKTSEDED